MKNNALTGAIVTFIVLGLTFTVFNSVTPVTQAAEEQTTTATAFRPSVETKLVATHTIEYVEQPATEVEYIEQVKYTPVTLRNFATPDELKQWLMNNLTAATVSLQTPEGTLDVDCDDYALELQQKAVNNGYLMSFQIIEPQRYNRLFDAVTIPDGNLHAIYLVIIENTAYYIEPQTGEIVPAAYID